MYFTMPPSSTGYYRGPSQFNGEGSDMGGNGAMASANPGSSTAQWQPTILYLFGLIIAEMVVFGIISRKI